MAWRFKASKYKNAAPVVPKFEAHIRDLAIGCYRSHGNFIAASAAYVAFNWDTHGSNLAVLPLDTKGRQNKAKVPLVYAHSEMVTDFQFSPFDDGLLATGSQDLTIKLWRLPSTGHMPDTGISDPELTLPQQPRRVETVNFNPSADNVLATSSADAVTVWDVVQGRELFTFAGHDEEVQSVGWQSTGRLLATQCKDKRLRVVDPRADGGAAMECDSHQGIKDSKVVWVGANSDRILTTGFSGDRLREINIRDLRNLNEPIKNRTLDMSSGILVPLFDPDTQMCFLCGKGDRNIQFIEVSERDPHIVEGLNYSGEQTKGACLVPKRAMDVMQGEVNRVLQLCDSSIVPVTWQVPRKSYRDYHADIFPETQGLHSATGPEDWWADKKDTPAPRINLDPKKRPKEVLTVFQETALSKRPLKIVSEGAESNGHSAGNGHNGDNKTETKAATEESSSPFRNGVNNPFRSSVSPSPPKPSPKPRVIARSTFLPPQQNQTNGKESPPQMKPEPRQRSINEDVEMKGQESASGDSNDDDGLALLRRQPSIRDRMKMLEASARDARSDSNGSTTHVKRSSITESRQPLARTISDTENKENKVIPTAPEKEDESGKKPQQQQPAEPLRKKNIFLANDSLKPEETRPTSAPAKRPASKMFGRISKFKHLKGDVILKGRFENLKNLSRTVPAECDFFHANADRVAVPLTGPGGKIAVFETRRPGRIPDGVTPVLINATSVMDFGFDPFDNSRLVAACDDGRVRLWKIPDGGLVQQMNEPEAAFSAHADKIQIVKFHPLAKDVLLTAAFDRTVKIWDLSGDCAEPMIELEGHEEQLYSAQFSQCGRFLATVCKDGKIRIYEPRKSSSPVLEGAEIVPKKGARIVWAMDGKYLIVTGFSRQSERQVMVYRSDDLNLLNTVTLDVSPAIIIPHYDADSNTLFLTGKGESTVTTFEVSQDAPHLFALSPYRPQGLHQGFSFLPKNVCNVREVEFARSYRLTNTTIEPISFTVPRVKTAFFQDDLFPPTRVLWEPTLEAKEWFAGSEKSAARLSLKPDDMVDLSEANNRNSASTAAANKTKPVAAARETSVVAAAPPPVTTASATSSLMREDAKKAETDIERHVSSMIETSDRLEQDDMEGVDDKEWDEE